MVRPIFYSNMRKRILITKKHTSIAALVFATAGPATAQSNVIVYGLMDGSNTNLSDLGISHKF